MISHLVVTLNSWCDDIPPGGLHLNSWCDDIPLGGYIELAHGVMLFHLVDPLRSWRDAIPPGGYIELMVR